MKLNITNVGKIGSATFEFNGITVIAGNNNTGKSTVGKSLFLLFHRFLNINNAVKNHRYNAFIKRVKNLDLKYGDGDNWWQPRDELVNKYNLKDVRQFLENELDIKDIRSTVNSIIMYDGPDKEAFYEELLSGLSEVKSISDNRLKEELVTLFFNNIFASQINNVQAKMAKAELELKIKNKPLRVAFEDSQCVLVEDNVTLTNKAIYIDDPYAIDLDFRYRLYNQSVGRDYINNILAGLLHTNNSDDLVDKIIATDKYKDIECIIDRVIKGNLIENKRGIFTLQNEDFPKGLSVNNISTGVKSFLVIKKLITDNIISEKDVLIFDEPEIHLHPEWQILYAELLVLIQKYFDLTILLTTHSPFFLRAIEVFSKKYETEDKCTYYMAKIKNEYSVFEKINDTSDVYAKMADAFSVLDKINDDIEESNNCEDM